MADWEEIKRLAADFQRTQTIDTLNRISERNCIDIIKKLIELEYIEIVYTCDGKELLTPDQLSREIEDEVHRNGGRMHLHELAAKLNVDYQHIEEKANQLVKTNLDYNLILGQLIHSTYKDALAKRINDKLLLEGQLSISEFSKNLDLPADYLLNILEYILKHVSSDIVVAQDRQTVYTADTIDKYKSIIIGTLTAIQKPTTIASLIKRLDIPERILLPTVEGLVKEGKIDACIENRQFIPASYVRQQNEYINKFYTSNSYIEYDVLSRMDIKQPKAFLKKKFPDGVQLKTCYISPTMISQVELMLDETVTSNGWIDVSTIVPTSIETEDIQEILAIIFKKSKRLQSSSMILDNTYVCSHGYIDICKRLFDGLMPTKALEDLKKGKLIEFFMVGGSKNKTHATTDKKKEPPSDDAVKVDKPDPKETVTRDEDDFSDEDERSNKRSKNKKNQGAGGAASQGREVKQKNVKKKYFVSTRGSNKKGGNAGDNSEIDTGKRNQSQHKSQAIAQVQKLVFQETHELKSIIEKQCSDDCSDEFLVSVVSLIEDELNRKYVSVAQTVLDEFLKAQEEEEQSKGEDLNMEETENIQPPVEDDTQ